MKRIIPPTTPAQYLTSTRWDRTKRISKLLGWLGGAPSDDLSKALQDWMLSAVARAMVPGCRADRTLILSGPPRMDKTASLEELGGLHLGRICSFERSSLPVLSESLIVEYAGPGRIEDLKLSLAATRDTYRPLYQRKEVTVARTCVFAMTTNEDVRPDHLSRRLVVVPVVRPAKVDKIRENRDQLWAEAFRVWERQPAVKSKVYSSHS